MINPVPQFVPQEVCISCDGCCRFKDENSPWRPKVSFDELKEKRHGLAEQIFLKDHIDTKWHLGTFVEKEACKCLYFDLKKNLCTIYTNRPFDCRLYPFLLTEHKEGVYIGVHVNCPFIESQLGNKEFEGFVDKLKNYFFEKENLDFIRRNRHLSSDYSEFKDEINYLFKLPL